MVLDLQRSRNAGWDCKMSVMMLSCIGHVIDFVQGMCLFMSGFFKIFFTSDKTKSSAPVEDCVRRRCLSTLKGEREFLHQHATA